MTCQLFVFTELHRYGKKSHSTPTKRVCKETFGPGLLLEPPWALEERAACSLAPSSVVIGVVSWVGALLLCSYSHIAAYSPLWKLTWYSMHNRVGNWEGIIVKVPKITAVMACWDVVLCWAFSHLRGRILQLFINGPWLFSCRALRVCVIASTSRTLAQYFLSCISWWLK